MDVSRYIQAEAPRRYVGDAENEGATALVGGRERVVSGWGAYEVEKRAAARRRAGGGGTPWYAGRSFVGGQDVLESVVQARLGEGRDPLERAVGAFLSQYAHLRRRLCSGGDAWACLGVPAQKPLFVWPISADEIERLPKETDLGELQAVCGCVVELAARLTTPPSGAPLPAKLYELRRNRAV